MRYFFILSALVFSNSFIFSGDYKFEKGKVKFLHTEEQPAIDAYNANLGTSTEKTNPYIAPTDFEIAVSTTFTFKRDSEYRSLLTKEGIFEKYLEEYKRNMVLRDINTNTSLNVDTEVLNSDTRLNEIKSVLDKAVK